MFTYLKRYGWPVYWLITLIFNLVSYILAPNLLSAIFLAMSIALLVICSLYSFYSPSYKRNTPENADSCSCCSQNEPAETEQNEESH